MLMLYVLLVLSFFNEKLSKAFEKAVWKLQKIPETLGPHRRRPCWRASEGRFASCGAPPGDSAERWKSSGAFFFCGLGYVEEKDGWLKVFVTFV